MSDLPPLPPASCGKQFEATYSGRHSDQWTCTLDAGHNGPHDWPERPIDFHDRALAIIRRRNRR